MKTQAQDSLYRLLLQSVTDYAIYMLSPEGIVNNWNVGAERAKGYTAEEIVGQHFSVFYPAADRERGQPAEVLTTALQTGKFEGEGWRVRKNGTAFWAHVTVQPIYDHHSTLLGFAKITRDLTEPRARLAREREQERNFRFLVQSVTDYAIYMLSPEGIVTNWNAGAERFKGYRAEEIVGQHFSRFYPEEDRGRGLPAYALATARQKGKFEGEGWRLRKDGSRFWAHVVIDPIFDDDANLIGFAKITRDITERKRIEDQVSHLARHDALTTLLNRAAFRETMEQFYAAGTRSVLLYLDLDRFKPVNDTLGHLVGDRVLQIVAQRIRKQLRTSDAVGRLGGDEFAVLLVNCEESAAAAAASKRLIAEIGRPIHVEDKSISIGVSIGIAFSNDPSLSPETVMRHADLALYTAKREGRGTYRWYESGMESLMVRRKQLELDLHMALLRDEFSLHYQPVVDANNGELRGYEALIRWQSPSRGAVPPSDFIPLAEENGQMLEIGAWVLQTACKAAAEWPEELTVSVNISPTQFRSQALMQQIASTLRDTGLPPHRLELEITETAMMVDISSATVLLNELRRMGIRIALDDFGTGYSSLSFLRALPITRIKVDRSFINDLGKTRESLAIVRAVAGLCSSLGVAITAEGVETAEQLEILQREGCDELQGFLIGRPSPEPHRMPETLRPYFAAPHPVSTPQAPTRYLAHHN